MAINKNNQPIGVFDSGVGGLSVLRELKHLLPNENFIFLADQLYVPYGEKSKKELVDLGCRITDYLINRHNIKMLVIACNTSTCNSIKELRQKYSFPLVGTVPAIKIAGQKTQTGAIAVIATPSTSKSKVLHKLIKDNCQNLNVFNISCKDLENLVEKGELNTASVNKLLKKYLKGIKNSEVDYLVLGCTHYPFLRKTIQKIVGQNVTLVDGGLAIAKRTKSLLKIHHIENRQKRPKRHRKILYFTTGDYVKFSKLATKLLGFDIKAQKVKI